jgi:hypothetical protein
MIKYTSFFIAIFLGAFSYAQVTNTSPYSYFGIGDFSQQNTIAANSMGGLSVATNGTTEMNFSNPAGNATLQFTMFSLVGGTHFLQINDGTTKQEASSTSLSYLALGFPTSKKSGIVIGLQPNSNVGYAITENILDDSEEVTEVNIFNGNGGTNRFFGSFGYRITKNLSLGVEGEYIFGEIDNNIINQRLGVLFATRHRAISDITGSSIKFGAIYQKEIKKDLELKVGASIKLANTLNATSKEYLYSFSYDNFGAELPKDTLINNSNISGKIERPSSWNLGVGVGKPRVWYAGIEYKGQAALNFDNSIFLTNNKVIYDAASKISIGGFWIPKSNSISNYWQRVTYRAGIRLENPGLSINATGNSGDFTTINDFGISFGLGLPIGNQLSKVNLGFEYGNRGNTTNGLIKENYFNLRLGLDLTDKWFRKRKIN